MGSRDSESLELVPVQGMPRWLGARATEQILRALSMEEQPQRLRSRVISPIEGYFRRDRHLQPAVDPQRYRLRMTGFAHRASFSLAELSAFPSVDVACVQECAGNGNHLMGGAGLVGQALWSGPLLSDLLEACGGVGSSLHVAFHGLDGLGRVRAGYHYGLSIEELLKVRSIIALRMNGEALNRRHGFPARLVVPQIYAMSHVKWLGRIEGKRAPHRGINNTRIYVNKEKRGWRWRRVQARWIGLKSVITRCVKTEAGWTLEGLAWGGDAPVERVEVSVDSGATWRTAKLSTVEEMAGQETLDPLAFEGAWVPFTLPWSPAPGRYRVGSRATSAAGDLQPLELPKHVRGHFDQCQVKWRDLEVPAGR